MAKKAYIGVETTKYLNSLGDVEVGSTVQINENGLPVDYLVVHQGNPDPTLYDASCDGTWVLRKNLLSASQWAPGTLNNAYNQSTANEYLNGSFFSSLDDVVKNSIKQSKIPYCAGGGSNIVNSGSNGLSAKVFLLSCFELGWGVTNASGYSFPADGAKLSYFVDSSGISSNSNRIATLNGTASDWWTRSPYNSNSSRVWIVTSSGSADGVDFYNSYCYRPAFILPQDFPIVNGLITTEGAESVTQSIARQVKKGYVGVDGVARKLKKAYIGIGGVARPCWSSGEPVYYGTITQVGTAAEYAGTTLGEYAFFAAVYLTGAKEYVSAVHAYDPSLTLHTPSALSIARRGQVVGAIGNYALVAGGYNGNPTNKVDVYDTDLVRTSTTLSSARYDLGSAKNSGHVLFGGGSNGSAGQTVVDAFDPSLVRSKPAALSESNTNFGAATSQYALFRKNKNLDAYDTSLTKTAVSSVLDKKNSDPCSATLDDRAMYAGGKVSDNVSAEVEIYDTALVRTVGTDLSAARYKSGSTVLGEFALVAGGYNDSSLFGTVDVYDADFTRCAMLSLAAAKRSFGAAAAGNHALLCGGAAASGLTRETEAFTTV